MTNEESGAGRDMSRTWEGRRAAAARRRALRAAQELRDTAPRAWGLEAFSDLTMLGHKAVEIIESESETAEL